MDQRGGGVSKSRVEGEDQGDAWKRAVGVLGGVRVKFG